MESAGVGGATGRPEPLGPQARSARYSDLPSNSQLILTMHAPQTDADERAPLSMSRAMSPPARRTPRCSPPGGGGRKVEWTADE